jgi:RHS repeat-associated protein
LTGIVSSLSTPYPSTNFSDAGGVRNEKFKYGYADANNGFLQTSLKSRYINEQTDPLTETAYSYHIGSNSVHTMTNTRFPTSGFGSFEASKHVYDLNEKGQRIQHDFTTDVQQTFNRRQSYLYNDKAELAVSNATGLLANGTPTTAIDADNRQYSFDALGNRLWAAGGLAAVSGIPTATPPSASGNGSSVVDTFTSSRANTYDDMTRSTGSGQGAAVKRKYDADGNMTFDGFFSYVWDGENRLIEIFPGEAKNAAGNPASALMHDAWLKFSYDYRGRRVSRERSYFYPDSTGWRPMSLHKFVFDGWNMVFSRNVITLQASAEVAANWHDSVYVWGQDISGMGGSSGSVRLQGAGGVSGLLVAQIDLGTTTSDAAPSYYLYDGNGNVTNVVNAAGNNDVVYRYDAFGNAEKHYVGRFSYIPWREQPITFSTKWRETTSILANEIPYTSASARHSALHYYGYRYYAPKEGRWLGRDPIVELGGVNLLGAFYNNAISQIDVLGRRTVTITIYHNLKKVEKETETELNRIFQQCFKKCKCKHKVKINWEKVDYNYKNHEDKLGDKLGKENHLGGFYPDDLGFFIYDNPLMEAIGYSKSYSVGINYKKIIAKSQGTSFNKTLATVIAHEVGFHGIGGDVDWKFGNPSGWDGETESDEKDQFVDSNTPAVGGGLNFSKPACKEICDELDID